MSEYVTVHKIGDREIRVDLRKKRVYAMPQGFISEALFRYGQSALDAVLAILAVVEPRHIDYILDLRYCEALPEEALSLWKEKALELASKYPQVHTVGVADADSPFWLQISQWKELFEAYGDRILGVFQTREKAETFLDELRGFSSVTS
jgi:hypothetical protein